MLLASTNFPAETVTEGNEDNKEAAESDLFGITFVPFATFCETAGFDCWRSNHRERKDHKTGFEEHEVKRERTPILGSSRSLPAAISETGQPFYRDLVIAGLLPMNDC